MTRIDEVTPGYAALGRNERQVVRLYERGVIGGVDEAVRHPTLTPAERAKVAEFLLGEAAELVTKRADERADAELTTLGRRVDWAMAGLAAVGMAAGLLMLTAGGGLAVGGAAAVAVNGVLLGLYAGALARGD